MRCVCPGPGLKCLSDIQLNSETLDLPDFDMTVGAAERSEMPLLLLNALIILNLLFPLGLISPCSLSSYSPSSEYL